MYMKS